MSYTVSFDASIKCKKNDLKGLLNHIERGSIDKKINHKNPNIKNDLTENNLNFYFNKNEDDFIECTDISQIENALTDRLKTVKKPLRKDAVIVRPLILQLDPEYYRDYEEENNEKSVTTMIEWACNTFGKENIIGGSLHLDEASPHLHLLFTPVTDDGRLSQKDWFKSPKELTEMHNSLREYMSNAGYDIEMSRKKTTKQVKRLTETEYRDYKELEEKALNVKNDSYMLERKSKRLNKKEASLNARESDLKAREEALASKEAELQAIQEKAVRMQSDASERLSECDKLLTDIENAKLDTSFEKWASTKQGLGIKVKNTEGKIAFKPINVLDTYKADKARTTANLKYRTQNLFDIGEAASKNDGYNYNF